MASPELEPAFHREIIELYSAAKKDLGYTATRFINRSRRRVAFRPRDSS